MRKILKQWLCLFIGHNDTGSKFYIQVKPSIPNYEGSGFPIAVKICQRCGRLQEP